MNKRFTKEQIEALNLDIHIALSANAGSGKTSVLVERYFKILEKALNENTDTTPDNIVAITFTKKAAAEMLSRIISKFTTAYDIEKLKTDKNKIDFQFLEKIRTFRNKLTNARISTIHSFCLQIISNYPIEAGIPVNFREISESERLQLIEDAFNRTLMNWLEDIEKKKKLTQIFSITNVKDLKELTYKTISNIDLWNDLSKLYSKDFNEYLNILKSFARSSYQSCVNELIGRFQYELLDFSSVNLSREDMSILKEFFSNYDRLAKDDYSQIIFNSDFWELLGNFINVIYTKNFTPRKRLFKDDQEIIIELKLISETFKPILQYLMKLVSYYNLIKELKKEFQIIDIEQRYFETSKSIFVFIKEVFAEFNKLKFDEGLIDFSDMLIKTKELLKNYPEILNEVRKDIHYLLVDEFQDTDNVQFEIIQLLVPQDLSDEEHIPNLFIVGDEKQSIYSFRNADVRVFGYAKEYISELNQIAGKDGGILKLTTTFRLKPEIAGFVDKIFSLLMDYSAGSPHSDFIIKYEPFVIPFEKFSFSSQECNNQITPITFLFEVVSENAKKEKKKIFGKNKDKENESKKEVSDSTKKLVETINNSNEEDEEEFSTLPILIAQHIKHIVNNESAKIFDKELGSYRTIRFSDIAIISRKTNDLAKISSVLGDFKIPFLFFGSKNFFSTREIQDVVAFLKFLINPKDNISLCAILRSVFFGFTDEMLANIALITSEKGLSFWEKLLIYYDFLNSESNVSINIKEKDIQIARVNKAVDVIRKLLPQVSILPINELIHRILVETEWHKKICAFENFEQILANMDELLDYAREYISPGFRTILDFLDEIDYISRHGVQDVDRYGFVASDAVILLTFHSAKGLEFPVVYVHNIDYSTKSTDQIEVSRELGLIFPIDIVVEDEIMRIDTIQKIFATEQLKLEQRAEELRILYVALTRASDFLIITGKIKELKGNDQSQKTTYIFSKKLEEIFNVFEVHLNHLRPNHREIWEAKIKVGTNNISGEYEIFTENISIPVEFIYDIFPNQFEDNASKVEQKNQTDGNQILLLQKVESSISRNVLSSTKFNLYSSNPRNYIRSYFLGYHRNLFEIVKSSLQEDYEARDDVILSSILGHTIHFCLENINNWYNKDGILVNNLVETIENAMFEQKRSLDRLLQNQIIEQCINIVQTKLFTRNKEIILSSEKEFEVLLPFKDNFLIAKFDILIQNEKGDYEIWDWKSNNVKNKEEMEFVAKTYELQMKTYVYALSLLKPEQSIFNAKLLFTRLAKPNSSDEEWTFDFFWSKDELPMIEKELLDYGYKINNIIL
ncbi:MAG: UvrD-helicase domain-containing protein [Ignavibacteria bacterium]|nr:UvrD-helicase domain-containing protein [Ignavibacteria bacterium]